MTYPETVRSLGCIVCRNLGHGPKRASLHHIRIGSGMGQRGPDELVLPLCPDHHQHGGHGVAIHAGQREWENLYGSELVLLAQTIREAFAAKDQYEMGL